MFSLCHNGVSVWIGDKDLNKPVGDMAARSRWKAGRRDQPIFMCMLSINFILLQSNGHGAIIRVEISESQSMHVSEIFVICILFRNQYMIQLSSATCRSMMGRNEVQLSAESINFITLYIKPHCTHVTQVSSKSDFLLEIQYSQLTVSEMFDMYSPKNLSPPTNIFCQGCKLA